MLNKLKHFDAYPKTLEDFRVKTLTGALISIVFTLMVATLFMYEWRVYLQKEVQQELFVDITRNQKLRINIDILFPHLPCDLIGIDAMDISGEQQIDVIKGIEKIHLNRDGNVIVMTKTVTKTTTSSLSLNEQIILNDTCGSCYGAESELHKCCTTCNDVRDAYRVKGWQFIPTNVEQCKSNQQDLNTHTFTDEQLQKLVQSGDGCHVKGNLLVNKVAGSFHLAPGNSYEAPMSHSHVHDIKLNQLNLFNTTHYINELYFGEQKFPSQMNPLDNTWSHDHLNEASIAYSYFIKIVPTTYKYELNDLILNNTYQYSVTKSIKVASSFDSNKALPGLFITYELSPIMIQFIEKQKSFSHFITSCCAIIGGLFTIAGLLDAFIFKYYNFYRKYQLNKLM